jgi:hypothetical protein
MPDDKENVAPEHLPSNCLYVFTRGVLNRYWRRQKPDGSEHVQPTHLQILQTGLVPPVRAQASGGRALQPADLQAATNGNDAHLQARLQNVHLPPLPLLAWPGLSTLPGTHFWASP